MAESQPLAAAMTASRPRLSLATLPRVAARGPAYNIAAVEVGVVHLGPGAFFRAHQAPIYEGLLAAGDLRWGVCGVSLHSPGVRDALSPQDGLYTLARLGADVPLQVIGALRELWVAPETPGAVRTRLASISTRVIALTVTEKGYHLDADGGLDLRLRDVAADLAGGGLPRTVYGWLVEALGARLAAGDPFPLLLSCDNLPGAGAKLKRGLVRFATARGEVALATSLEADLVAPDSMVDSITPATDEALRTRVRDSLGLDDVWPVQREPFAQWVIGRIDHPALAELEAAGVILTDDVAGYERAKLRLLNGAHSTLAYLGLLADCETVAEAMARPAIASAVERLMRRDLSPTVRPPAGLDAPAYIDTILARFRNAAVRHQLEQIATDGSQKLPIRIGAAGLDALRAGADVTGFALPFAAWWRWVVRRAAEGSLIADVRAEPLAALARAAGGDAAAQTAVGLGLAAVLPAELAATAAFRIAFAEAYARLASDGAEQA